MKALYQKHHPGSLKIQKCFSNRINLPKLTPSTYEEKFHNILQHHADCLYVFTDGSKANKKTACVAVLNKTILKEALQIDSSIFTAEAHTIDLALNIIFNKHEKFNI